MQCKQCGNNLPEGTRVCPACGGILAAQAPDPQAGSPLLWEDGQNGAPAYQPPPAYQLPGYPYSAGYSAPPYAPQGNPADREVRTGEWMWTLLVAAIPFVGFIVMLVWAFGAGTIRSKQNWARATLLWSIIPIVVVIVVFLLMALGVGFAGSRYMW